MNIRDAYNAKAIALVHTEVASNKIAYLGSGLFPAKKKMGLDLKWIKTSNGLPVTLKHLILMQFPLSEAVKDSRCKRQKWHSSVNL